MNEENEVHLSVGEIKTTTDTVVQIFTAIGTAVALILLAFGYITDSGAGDNQPEARGVTNFDSITLSEDLVVGDDVTITGALSVGGDDVDAIHRDRHAGGDFGHSWPERRYGRWLHTGRNAQHRFGRACPVLGGRVWHHGHNHRRARRLDHKRHQPGND